MKEKWLSEYWINKNGKTILTLCQLFVIKRRQYGWTNFHDDDVFEDDKVRKTDEYDEEDAEEKKKKVEGAKRKENSIKGGNKR